MEIDEFEGHYTIQSCLEAVLVRHYEETNNCPYAVDMNLAFYHNLVMDLFEHYKFRFMQPISDFRRPFMYTSVVGSVEIRSDVRVSKERVFELCCKCSMEECLLRELGLSR